MSQLLDDARGMCVTVGSHVPADVAAQLAQLARANDRSISGELRVAIRKHLAETAQAA
jgi:hypothetical protein